MEDDAKGPGNKVLILVINDRTLFAANRKSRREVRVVGPRSPEERETGSLETFRLGATSPLFSFLRVNLRLDDDI